MSGNVRMERLLQEILKMSYEELKKRCRMCCCPLQQEGIHTIQLFTPENRHVVDQIWTYLRIKIEETDPFSSHICYNCYEKFYTLGSKIQEFRRIQDIQFENKEYINKFSRENNNIVSPTLYQPAGSVEPSDHNDGLAPASNGRSVGNDADAENFPYPNEENMTGQSLKRKRTSICSGPITPTKRRLIILTPKQINQRYKQLSSDSTTTTLSEYNIQTASSSQESQQNFAHQITFNVECSFQLQPIQQVTVQQPNDSHQMYGNTIFSSQENDGHFI